MKRTLDAQPSPAPVLEMTRRAERSPAAAAVRPRLDSIDLLRGLVMVLMALDHTRDFFAAGGGMNPRDVGDPALFLTRWITHFCAPVFILLAGVSAWLYGARGRSVQEVSWFLLTRGLWLMLFEFTVVRLGWQFNLSSGFFVTQVIWVIGASMVVLAGLVYLPRWAILAVALAMIAGHNAFDGVNAEALGAAGWMWNLLHEPGLLRPALGIRLYTLYPLVPWAGVMAAGYVLGPVFKLNPPARIRWLIGLGTAAVVGFLLLRAANVYGDPEPWLRGDGVVATLLSFVNCEKYPPSLLYLLMTLGPALLLLAAFDRVRGALAGPLVTFGRVPLFYYVVHIYLIHALALGFAWVTLGEVSWLLGSLPDKPAGYGVSLPWVYAVTLLVVLALAPLCRWYAGVKQRRTEWWWSYL